MKTTIKGLKRYRSKGIEYVYHRATGTRIMSVPGTPEFLAEVAKCAKKKASTVPDTLGGLIGAYKTSPEFLTKKPRTKTDYEKVFDYLKPISAMPLKEFTPKIAVGIRDKAYQKRKRRFANYVVVVLKLLCNWGGPPREFCATNPMKGVDLIERPKDAPQVNRPWTDDEIATVLKHAPMSLKSAVLIALCTSLREGDVAKVPWSIYDGTMIDATHGKNGQHLYVRAHPLLKKCLDGLPNNPAKIEDPKAKKLAMTQPIVIGDRSRKPYHGYGFYSRFWKFISKLETDGLVGPGLTFHGLRHSVATRLAEAGATTHQIMAITGHRDEATVKLYIAKADKKKWAAQAMDLLSLPV